MSRTAIPQVTHIDESESSGRAMSLPRISYTQAMRSWFIHNGCVQNVERCEQAIFRAYIERITAHLPSCTRAELGADIASSDMLTRWYVLLEILRLKVPGLHLYESEAEARDSLCS